MKPQRSNTQVRAKKILMKKSIWGWDKVFHYGHISYQCTCASAIRNLFSNLWTPWKLEVWSLETFSERSDCDHLTGIYQNYIIEKEYQMTEVLEPFIFREDEEWSQLRNREALGERKGTADSKGMYPKVGEDIREGQRHRHVTCMAAQGPVPKRLLCLV